MLKAFLFDFSRTILFPKDRTYTGSLNDLNRELSNYQNYNFLDHFELDEDLLGYLETVKDKELYIFTSEDIQNTPEIKPRLDKVFKKVFSAKEIGLNKKDPKAYEYISEQIGLTPDQVLFVDDSEANIEAAKKSGMVTWLYSDFKSLQEKLIKALKGE